MICWMSRVQMRLWANPSDERNNKTTYVTLHGIEESREAVERLSREALDIVRDMRHRNEFLENLITWMINRDR